MRSPLQAPRQAPSKHCITAPWLAAAYRCFVGVDPASKLVAKVRKEQGWCSLKSLDEPLVLFHIV